MSIELGLDTPFNLDHTLGCGQVFRWSRIGSSWLGVVGGSVVKIVQEGNRLIFHTSPDEKGPLFIRRYLRLDDDLPMILARINRDEVIAKAINELCGLRLVRQDPWECLMSFICATYANIPRIRGMIENLSRRFGERIGYEDDVLYAFPSKEALAKASLRDLIGCGLGFRARYVLETARTLCEGFDLEGLRRLSYGEARRTLLTLTGVGPKVADCALLFSLDKLEAFPVDVRIIRIMSEQYAQQLSSSSPSARFRRISDFGRAYFGEYAGYAQEYLYHYYRSNKNFSPRRISKLGWAVWHMESEQAKPSPVSGPGCI